MYNANNNNSSGVTQLEFNQAMSDFKHMFPDMEEDVIEAVLRANNGVVDATIDQLLQISTEKSQKKKAANQKNDNIYKSNIFVDGPSIGNPKSYSKELNFFNEHKISRDSMRYKRRWEPPYIGELSPDFLRITLNETQKKLTNLTSNNDPQQQQHHHHHLMSSSFLQQKMEENKRNRQTINDDPEMAQYLEDERFAILLQNEEFVRELRMNQDFMSSLESDHHHYISGNTSTINNNNNNNNNNDMAQASNFLDSDAIFKERLKNMGKVSKKKFTQLARLFSGRMRKNFKQLDNAATNREQYFYQDLSNDNYEDVGPNTTTGDHHGTTMAASSSSSSNTNQQHHDILRNPKV